jgi:hypothetical protein
LFAKSLLGLPFSHWEQLKSILRAVKGCFFGLSPRFVGPEETGDSHLTFSWILKDSFEESLAGHDRYFGKLSKEETSTLVRVFVCTFIPSLEQQKLAIENKCGLIWFERDVSRVLRASSILLRNILDRQISFSRLWMICDERFIQSEILVEEMTPWITRFRFTHSIFAYEQQPWQTALIFALKNRGVKTVGLIHSSMDNFPIHFMNRPGSPDYLVVQGLGLKDAAVNLLGWLPHQVTTVKSLRYRHRIALQKSTLFLPYLIMNRHFIADSLEALLSYVTDKIAPFDVKIHPVLASNKDHVALKNDLEKVLARHAKKFDISGKPVGFVIGPSAALYEMLENGYETYAAFFSSFYDGFNPEIWPDLDVVEVARGLFRYALRRQNSFIQYANPEEERFVFQEIFETLSPKKAL